MGGNDINRGVSADAFMKALGKNRKKINLTPEQKEAMAKAAKEIKSRSNINNGNAIDDFMKTFVKNGKVNLTPEQREAIAKWFQEHKTPQNPDKIPGFHFEHTEQMKYGANVPTKPTQPVIPESQMKYGVNTPTKPPKRKKLKFAGQEIQMKYGVNTGGCGKPPIVDSGTRIKYGVNTGTRYHLK